LRGIEMLAELTAILNADLPSRMMPPS